MYYVLIPVFLGGMFAVVWFISKRMRAQFAVPGAMNKYLTNTYGSCFRLNPDEELVRVWMGQLYDGPLTPEFTSTTGDKLKTAAKEMLLNRKYITRKINVACTNAGRMVVGLMTKTDDGEFPVKPHSEWVAGAPIYLQSDLAGHDLGAKPASLRETFGTAQMEFVMFGGEPGQRLPAWMPVDCIDIIGKWRVDPIATTRSIDTTVQELAHQAQQQATAAAAQQQAQPGQQPPR